MKIKNIEIQFLGHSGFLITTAFGKQIAIDPYNISDKAPKADIVLITHNHQDHCSIRDIEKIAKENATIIIPADAQSKITKIKNVDMQIIELGDKMEIEGIKIETIAAYNTNKKFHPKREGWFGYIIKLQGVIIYHAGDTDKIPEMSKLTGYGKHGNEFIVLLPVSGVYTMDAEEATEVASLLSPDLAIPMHYGAGVAGTIDDAQRFQENCKKLGLKVEILEKI